MLTEKVSLGSSNSPVEQFVLLAKSAKGAGACELIKQALEAQGVYVFGELLEMPHITELENTEHSKYLNLLKLFAYGTYREYLAQKADLPELTPVQQKKLKHLTLVTMATEKKCIPYTDLLLELDIKNVRDLEDLIIEAIYADIIHGKLDQKDSQLEVDFAIGRDIRFEDIGTIVDTLQQWCDSCETVLSCIETQINRANTDKSKSLKHKEVIEQEVANIKKTLKSQTQDVDEAMATDTQSGSSVQVDKTKKTVKGSRLRGSGSKFWQKS
ncbi:COP9 signalosome complex subunit 7a [Neocloeon triangulifer]|uniref:COP9 signalosome complex subunit 7a n=1 Tax=Neocloeon triangulifer TaxID=2078957 RepID=UPI00286F7150|nr:COP9 signalosome complex subunit 7a [Neocloeon triangulifer]XP_059475466.1 COP9 signalosome complex subunit 7a [Neocloeon triangulifer]